jgi:hypothetical protein
VNEPFVLQLGARPWHPSSSVRLVRELNYYDMPTEGILRRRFVPVYYFFACIDGAVNEYNLWVYAPIKRSEARRLKKLSGDELRAFEVPLLLGRPLVIALAHETEGLKHRAHVKLVREEKLDKAEPKLARAAWSTVTEDLKAEAGAVQKMALC